MSDTILSVPRHPTPYSRHPFLAGLLALSLAVSAPAVGQRVTLHSELVQGRAALGAGQPDVAAALARRALDRDPADREAAVLLGLSLEAQGQKPEAVAVLAATARPVAAGEPPTLPPAARTALDRLLPAALPAQLAVDLQAVLPGAGAVGTVGATAFRVVAPEGMLSRPATDPKYGWQFSRRAAVYIGEMRRYSVYYQRAKDRDLAVRIADLLGRLHGAAAVLPAAARPAEVRIWLPRAGQAGGEQFRDSIYLFAVNVARSDGEWVREVAHELGHVVLPSFARFDAPEPMENGYLGERLLPKWLMDMGVRTLWEGRVSLAEYVRSRAAPLRSRFLDAGPASPLRLDRSPAGMDYAIGLILTLDAQHGAEFMARVFARTTGAGLESLLLAYRDEVSLLRQYRIPADLLVPRRSLISGEARGRLRFRRAAYRAYLPSGRWQISARGERLGTVKVRLDDRHLPVGAGGGGAVRCSLATDVSRWHLIQLEAAGPGSALTEIVLTAGAMPPVRAAAAAGNGAPLRGASRQERGVIGAK